MLKIAITGNIASGKSCVEEIIARNFPVYDADRIAHKILDDIKEFEGLDVFTDGKIDRKKLAAFVFNDYDLRKKLENIIHPEVKNEIIRIFEQNYKVVFISIPLLFETGMDSMFDKILFVSCNDEIRLERLMQRNNLTKEEALVRMNAQMPQEEKIKKSDYIILNNSTKKDLEKEVLVFIGKLESLI